MERYPARWLAKTDILLAALALLSVAVLLIPKAWITRSYTLDLSERAGAVYSDSHLGGISIAQELKEANHAWRCELRAGFSDPFCSYQINLLDDNGQGMDLSKYQSLTLALDYQGSARSVRLYLRNRNPNYYVLGDLGSTKYNAVELDAQALNDGEYTVNLSDFSVADWWINARSIPPHLSGTDFEDVLFLEIQTGADASSGDHRFVLNGIRWSGPIIGQKALYRGLIALWVLAIVAVLVYRVVQLNLALKRNAQQQRQLMKINKLLNLQNKQVEDLAKTDPLTGIANRLGVRQPLYDGVVAWQRDGQAMSMVMIDIDDFKKLNDQHGHDIGDAVLKEVAATLANSVRSTDIVARWGGEEFMVVCPDTELAQARIVAENLRSRIAHLSGEGLPKVTASFGVATMTRDDLDYLFKQADEALYSAKHSGKNRVMSAAPGELVGLVQRGDPPALLGRQTKFDNS